MSYFAGFCGHLAIHAWLAGNISTADLHEELTDSEYLRYLDCDYYEELWCRYESLYETPVYWTTFTYVNGHLLETEHVFGFAKGRKPAPKAVVYSLSSAEGCEIEWDHGGFAS